MPRFLVSTVSVTMMVLGAGVVSGQTFPNKPIRIVTGGVGGGLDFAARLIAPGLLSSLGQPIIVDNRGSIPAPEIVARASADGHTLIFYGSPFWLAPFMRKNVPYDPVKDFSPITLAVTAPNVLVVHSSVAANSVKELIALAKAQPGKLNYASSSLGSAGHLGTELFKAMAGVNIVEIPYKGGAQVLNALIGNEVQLMLANAGGVAPLLKSGKLKVLAVTSPQPSALLPGVPTVAASGLPGYESVTFFGVFAPAKTPAAVIDRLNQEIVRVLNQPDVKERLLTAGVEVVAGTPEQLAVAVKSEMAALGKVIKDVGIRAE
ncbi:MAG: tripartite tricarboxylate transporter substrate binding protein [Betaproteobacteria bacterium]|nr:tripartite tricarboxylate transporter substrate binding protein [Betaproteobacteria bacterium]